ncbi:MAG: cation:proton antiporter [Kiritimatiellae bacterium]|jgi:Kef-type K+ transport system membrane component KefB/mannitol/fructose-specific phosphotransferase system IIA component (Ntr-type)|nr:cation:proton antiporter [Kiritimatiellia bacterium]
MHYLDENMIFIFLVQVSLLLGFSRAAGLLLRRIGQPAISGEILVGILLGPTLFGRMLPGLHAAIFPPDAMQQNMLETVAWLGILFFLLDAGLNTNLVAALRQRRDALKISLSDLILPMIIAFIPVWFLPECYIGSGANRLLFSLFIATIMTISALPVTARILQDLGIYKSDASLLTMCALTINDIAGWLVFAVILGFVTGGHASLLKIPIIIAATIVFTLFCFTAGKKITDRLLSEINYLELPQSGTSLTLIFILGMVGGATTLAIGIHALFGFFIVGIMAGESRHLSENSRETISQLVRALLVPLFFASIGLKIDFLKELDLPLIALMLGIGVAGRFIGAWVGVSITSHPKTNRHLISAAHTPGGEMQIVIGILAMEYAVITPPVFVSIIVSAVLSSVLAGPWMKVALKRGRKFHPATSLNSSNIIPSLIAANRDEVIQTLCERTGMGLNPQEVTAAVLKREELMGTALGYGVAVPHARMEEIATPRLGFARVPAGIEWNAPDGKPVQFIFLLLTPAGEDDSQLHMLRAIGKTMNCTQNREQLLSAHDSEIGSQLITMFGEPC